MNMFQSNNSQLYELVNEKLNQMNPCFDFVESQFSCIRNKKFPHFQGYLETTIRENEELCRNLNAPDARSIRKIVFDLPEPVQYDTAGIASIIPQNPLQLVQLLVKRLGLNEFKTFNVAKNGSEVISVSLLHLLTQYLDFLSPISSDQVLVLCRYASNESEFSELSSVVLDESGTTLKEWKAKRLCLLDVLEMYRSVMIPDFVLVQMLPSMKPRKYSISSSSKTSSQSLALTVSHVKLFTQGVMQQGLCSSFLCGSSVGDHVLLNVESSSFSIPDHVETPMILLGMGCGCSPIRSIVEDNAQQTKDMRPLYLYLGCRNRNIDLIYEEEFLDWKQKGVINEIHYAFSRDGNEKKYVQDSLREQGDLIWDLISNQNATLFMCGSKQMGIDVVNTLVQIAMVYGLMSDELAHGFVSKLQNSEKIVGELF